MADGSNGRWKAVGGILATLAAAALAWSAVAIIDTRQDVAVIEGSKFTDVDGQRLKGAIDADIHELREQLASIAPILKALEASSKDAARELKALQAQVNALGRQIDKLDNRVAVELDRETGPRR